MSRYFIDVDDTIFGSFIPTGLREREYIDVTYHRQSHTGLPINALKMKVDRLTEVINERAAKVGAGPYDLARLIQDKTYIISDTSTITDAELWYHQSGKSTGKVIRVQLATYAVKPFLRMTAASVARNEVEDSMVLQVGFAEGSSANFSEWSTYEIYKG